MNDTTTEKNGFRILIVEDSATQREHVIGLCEKCGFESVQSAVNGQDALKKMESEAFDIALIDLEMPIMDGVELLRHIADQNMLMAVIIFSSKDPSLILSVGTMAEEDGLKVIGTFQKPMTAEYIQCSLRSLQLPEEKVVIAQNDSQVQPEDLVKAIDNDEIEFFYQPKVSSKNFILTGVESLARWHHPTKGNISPLEFVSLAERFGLVTKMTKKLLTKALKQKQRWQQHGANFNIALNLSPHSLAEKGFADYLCSEVSRFGIKPESIIFEITENAVCGEISTAIEMLARLRLKGFQLAIDDYGTGYANAQQLSRIPATELKIDRCLINNVATKPQQQSILANTIQLAKELKYRTVAEGVETDDDLRFVQSLNIDLVQGYLVAKPMSADKLEQWVKSELSALRHKFKV